MADLTDENSQTILRNIVREETADLKKNLADLSDNFDSKARTIIREETDDIRDDVKTIKYVQGQQSITLRTIQIDVNGLKSSLRHQAKEMNRVGVLLEDLEHRFQTGTELES